MVSPTRWTWVWVDSGSWWWTGRPGMLRFMGSQRVGHDWATELNWTENQKDSLVGSLGVKNWCQIGPIKSTNEFYLNTWYFFYLFCFRIPLSRTCSVQSAKTLPCFSLYHLFIALHLWHQKMFKLGPPFPFGVTVDQWVASPVWWTWTWANFRRWWETGKPDPWTGKLQSMRSQRVAHDWASEQQQKHLSLLALQCYHSLLRKVHKIIGYLIHANIIKIAQRITRHFVKWNSNKI